MTASDRKTLYSKRYIPTHRRIAQPVRYTPPTDAAKAKNHDTLQEFWRRIDAKGVRPPASKLPEDGQRFVLLARELSEACQIDADVIETPGFLDVHLHLYCWSEYPSQFSQMLAPLVSLCDTIGFFTFESEPSDFTIVLTFRTRL